MSLYHKYRPTCLEEVIGNENLIATLTADLGKEDRPHSFLLHGPTGCGKTTIGRIIGNMLGCAGTDFKEIDTADFRGIDTIRELRKQSQFMPMEADSTCRVFLIDECHALTSDAQKALLKALEDSPPHVYYILATTDPQDLLDMLKGRCHQYQVNLLTEKEMYRLLKRVVRREKQELDSEIFDQIIQDSLGHPRNALQVLDQTLGVAPEKRLAVAQRIAESQSKTIELCRALMQNSGWKKVARILDGLKEEQPEKIRRSVLGYCTSILMKGDNLNAAKIMEQMMQPVYANGWSQLVFEVYSAVKMTENN